MAFTELPSFPQADHAAHRPAGGKNNLSFLEFVHMFGVGVESHSMPLREIERIALSPCSMTMTLGWYSTVLERRGAMPNFNSLSDKEWISTGFKTVAPGTAFGPKMSCGK